VLRSGFVDTLKGSYYANINPAIGTFKVSSAQRQDYPEYYGENICVWHHQHLPNPLKLGFCTHPGPKQDAKGLEGFEEAFKDLGRFVVQVCTFE
jgi:hypothetical protein